MRRLRCLWLLAIALFAVASTAFGQFSSNLQGVVEDTTQARIPGVSIQIKNLDTGIAQEIKASDAGYYRFSSLQPGRYELKAEKNGFQTKTVTLSLGTGQTGEYNVTLAVAGATQTIQVSEQAPILDTADSRVQVTLNSSALRDMPIQGRNFLSLVAIAPGVTGIGSPGGDNFANEATPDISGNGRNATGNMYTVDGLSTNSNITSGTTNLNPNPDTIQEMAVQTSNFTVDQGSTSSVVVAMTSKSGTNEYHGSGSYYFTNQNLKARSVFTQSYEPFKRHDLSATFGGPVIKNKTFGFASVQPLYSASSSGNSTTTYESPEFVAWAKQTFPDALGTKILSQVTPSGIATTGVAKYASDLFPGTCGTAATFNLPCGLPMIDQGTNKPSPYRNGLQYNFRGDQYLRDSKERIYFNYNRMNVDSQNPAIRTGMQSVNNSNSRAVQSSWTHTFSPTVLNELSFGGSMVFGQNSGGDAPFHIPDINITGVGTGISPGWSGNFTQHNYNWKDVVSWVRGSHSIKFGGQYSWGDDWADFSNIGNRPSFQFNSLLDLVQDKPYSEGGVQYNPLTGKPAPFIFGAKINTYSAFVQDEWKVKSNLTLTLGVRFDDFGNATGFKGMTYNQIFPATASSVDARFADASIKVVDHPFSGRQHGFSPRLGYAWSPGKSGKWSVRGGIGMYHDGALLGETVDAMRSNPPGFVYPTFRQDTPIKPLFAIGTSDKYPFGFPLPDIGAGTLDSHGGLVGTRPDVGGTARDLSPSSTLNYIVGVERQLAGKTVVGLNYSGSRTWDGIVGSDFNRRAGDLLDGSYDRLNQSFGAINYVFNGNSVHYNAMIASVRKELGSRGAVQASYTFGKTTDLYQGGSRSNGYESSYDQHIIYDSSTRESLRSNAGWDVRHRFSLSGSYELPTPFKNNAFSKHILGGWQITMLAIMQSGTPLSVYNGNPFSPLTDASGAVIGLAANSGDYNADGTNFDFPNLAHGSIDNSHSRQDFLNKGIFTLSDFTAPALGTNGSEKRNLFRNPGYLNLDSSMIKNNRLPFWGERVNLQIKFEFFNVLNRVNLGGVDANMFDSTFGKSTWARDPRTIQLGARLTF
jgi:hypothetical protein